MKTEILSVEGKKIKEIELPKFFSAKIREDILSKVLESKKNKQPYSPSIMAGRKHSASGIIRHRRHVWKTHYGQGISRIPRKITSVKGNRFNWIGAEIPFAVGGRRAHPPKTISMINTIKINKKENKIAFISALSATADAKKIKQKYQSLNDKKIINFPLIVESKLPKLKTKELIASLRKILGELFDVATRKRSIRSGKGKLRGRKYKKTAGVLIVLGNKEKIKTNAFETKNVKSLGVLDLAKGKEGRLVIYTEQAIKDLEERLK